MEGPHCRKPVASPGPDAGTRPGPSDKVDQHLMKPQVGFFPSKHCFIDSTTIYWYLLYPRDLAVRSRLCCFGGSQTLNKQYTIA